ncbi:MAG: RagB/SusD family nutrient uptake outer membrane protein [Parabacteroides sp.]|nr:RagB/SusD family nutrient uptake outer membrane protein [Parabacteroides sp.]
MKKIAIYSLAVLSLGLASCSDFLTEEPKTEQSNELTLGDYDGLNKATLGAYAPLYAYNWYGSAFVLGSDLRSGNARRATLMGSGRYVMEYNWTYNESATSGLWSYAYFVISAANNVINNLEGKESTEVTAQDLNNLKAECLFLRALSHFDLLRTYAQPYTHAPNSLGVPVVLVSEVGSPARNTVAEGFEQVVKDLTEAESIMEDGYERAGVTDVYATVRKEVIQALLSRVYLYMGEWQKAADYATKVINCGKYAMFTAEEFGNPDTWGVNIATEGKEVIFEVYGAISESYNAYWEEISDMVDPEGYADVAASQDLIALYAEGDVRGSLFQGAVNPDSGEPYPYQWTLKYPGKQTSRPTTNNIPVIRLSEMYLNRAETIARGASVSGVTADSDLKVITSNRGAADVTATVNSILLERRKELAFEGHYIYDLARTGNPVKRVDYDGSESARNIDFPDYRWALPIPKSEIECNPNMVQNEGY